jgi:TetR/AcrR family transcriptional regulator, transcriptional repressor for nem operon
VGARREDGESGTATRILDVAERLVQTRGFNGFSYADIAAELEVTKASLHYHFASKTELGETLINRYAERFAERLSEIDAAETAAAEKLEAYADVYAAVLRDRRMCLCGMLAAEYETLPEPIRAAILRFFDDSEAWLVEVLEEGRSEGSLDFQGAAKDEARGIVSGLEGALLVARPYGDVDRFEAAAAGLLKRLSTAAA